MLPELQHVDSPVGDHSWAITFPDSVAAHHVPEGPPQDVHAVVSLVVLLCIWMKRSMVAFLGTVPGASCQYNNKLLQLFIIQYKLYKSVARGIDSGISLNAFTYYPLPPPQTPFLNCWNSNSSFTQTGHYIFSITMLNIFFSIIRFPAIKIAYNNIFFCSVTDSTY